MLLATALPTPWWLFSSSVGDDLTRENVMRQATNIKNLELPMLVPDIKINTSAINYHPIRQLRLARFEGKHWVGLGGVIGD
jgi:branched-chain amino acid transport system substrate-binding protein